MDPPRRAKSRKGCSICKTRKIKCDETKPKCMQCQRKNLDCPGYTLRWKWSDKHERWGGSTKIPRPTHAPTVLICERDERQVDQAHILFQVDSAVEESDGPTEAVPEEDGSALVSNRSTSHTRDSPSDEQCKLIDVHPYIHRASAWKPPDAVWCDPCVQVDFFAHQICKVLFAYDSKRNPLKTAMVSQIRTSILHFSLCRYLTAAFLHSGSLEAPGAANFQLAQVETLQRLHSSIANLFIQGNFHIRQAEQLLTTVTLFGLSTNWDGSDHPSYVHYNAAVTLYYRISEYAGRKDGPTFDREGYLSSTLVYWWMGLTFTTDSRATTLYSPPQHSMTTKGGKIHPHPLTGVGLEAVHLLGRVGLLVRGSRERSRQYPLASFADIAAMYAEIQSAQTLEEELLSLKVPSEEECVDVEDLDTPLSDLINIAEVHRLCGIMLIYRVFPDVLNKRIKLGMAIDAEEQSLPLLTSLALRSLEVLNQNTPFSGTRSIEQVLLLIIAAELQLPQSSRHEIESNSPLDPQSSGSDSSRSDTDWTGLDSNQPTQHTASDSPGDKGRAKYPAEIGKDRILVARNAVKSRLKSIRTILPYKATAMVEQLIHETWERSDEAGWVFWMDLMMNKGWAVLLV